MTPIRTLIGELRRIRHRVVAERHRKLFNVAVEMVEFWRREAKEQLRAYMLADFLADGHSGQPSPELAAELAVHRNMVR